MYKDKYISYLSETVNLGISNSTLDMCRVVRWKNNTSKII